MNVAEELVQDTFIGFYNQKMVVSEEPSNYLKGILRHKVLDYFRNNKNNIVLPIDERQVFPELSENDTFYRITGRETGHEISMFVEQLPAQCRKVYLMSREEELSNKEIAEKLGISVKAVEAHITKALKFLRENIDRHWALIATVVGIEIFK